MLYPFIFQPILKERIWGGRQLERLYAKPLPPGKPIGESWEISDRPGDASVIANGPLAGKTLRWLMENHAAEILGKAKPAAEGRFPLLCKILDAREKLSLQVHPRPGSAGVSPASSLGESGTTRRRDGSAPSASEPKTEMWFITDAAPDASLYVGLKRGVTRAEFEKRISDGSVADCFHRIPVRAGDAMFLPSGRVHAIGAGLVIFEIQQNSDTTYRVFDWNRVGLDGKPRELHVAQSLASIDFNDFEPGLVGTKFVADGKIQKRSLVNDPLFHVEAWKLDSETSGLLKPRRLQIIAATGGKIEIKTGLERGRLVRAKQSLEFAGAPPALLLSAGQFCLIPASLDRTELLAKSDAALLFIEAN